MLTLLGILPGLIALLLCTKEYLVGITETRLIVLQFRGDDANVKRVLEYALHDVRGRAVSTKGPMYTSIIIDDLRQPFAAKLHRLGAKANKWHAEAIADALAL